MKCASIERYIAIRYSLSSYHRRNIGDWMIPGNILLDYTTKNELQESVNHVKSWHGRRVMKIINFSHVDVGIANWVFLVRIFVWRINPCEQLTHWVGSNKSESTRLLNESTLSLFAAGIEPNEGLTKKNLSCKVIRSKW